MPQTLLAPGIIHFAAALSWQARLADALLMHVLLQVDQGEAWWRSGFETYTCTMSIVEGSLN
jgi:hypothetical protein